jgi:hypothetical protein
VLVLHEQQLDVLQDEQLEQEQLELHQPAASWPRSTRSSISNVAVSRTSNSSRSAMVVHPLSWAVGVVAGSGDEFGGGVARRSGPPREVDQLVLLQLQLEQPQQLEVLQDEQLDVLVLELHQPAASLPTSAISSTSKVTDSRDSNSVARSVVRSVVVIAIPSDRGGRS